MTLTLVVGITLPGLRFGLLLDKSLAFPDESLARLPLMVTILKQPLKISIRKD